MRWKSIDTAPRDGTEILAGSWTQRGTCLWIANGYFDDEDWCFAFACESYDNSDPEFWSELPNPPEI